MIVTLLTDYGRDDDFVGVCHGVIRTIHPDGDIVDITHGIEPGVEAERNDIPGLVDALVADAAARRVAA